MPPFPFSYCCLGSGAHLLFHARQPAKAPGGHINYIAAPPLFSHVYLRVCLLSQTMPICSLSISTAVYSYLLCVSVCVRVYVCVFFSCSQIYLCICTNAHVFMHTLLLPLSGRSQWLVGKSSPESTHCHRLSCTIGSGVCARLCVCVCGCLLSAWLPFAV